MAETQSTCAACGATEHFKQCGRCKTVSYCSTDCQKVDWKTHKPACRFTVVTQAPSSTPLSDPLSLLLAIHDPGTSAQSLTQMTKIVMKTFNVPELRLAVFSMLSARDLLRVQRVCRSWYHTIAKERKLQQRLFFAPGPSELVFPARKGMNVLQGIQPRNKKQRDHNEMTKSMSGGGSLHLVATGLGTSKEVQATELEKAGDPIVLNPFFTSLWPQDRTNMTSSPRISLPASAFHPTASWRRMQLTSPPILQVDTSVWFTKSSGKGTQLLPSTGKVPSGVTLGHIADLFAAQPRKLTLHWWQIHTSAWWARSADAIVVPKEGEIDHNGARPGVYVNPSNGIEFPGFV